MIVTFFSTHFPSGGLTVGYGTMDNGVEVNKITTSKKHIESVEIHYISLWFWSQPFLPARHPTILGTWPKKSAELLRLLQVECCFWPKYKKHSVATSMSS